LHAHHGPALLCPLKPYKLLTNSQNLINNKENIHGPISSIKATSNQNETINNKRSSTLQKSEHTFVGTNP
jgi:hypothetical protein